MFYFVSKKAVCSLLLCAVFFIFLVNNINAAPILDASDIYKKLSPSLCILMTFDPLGNEIATGSGFLISSDGKVATNAHVLTGADSVIVECNSQKSKAHNISLYKENLDLAVLETGIRNDNYISLASRKSAKPGTVIFALGNPYGLNGTITTGLISGIRTFQKTDYIQISADINPGNSGGPVALSTGEVIGVATMGFKDAQGLNFALPADLIATLPKVNIKFTDVQKVDKNNFHEGSNISVSSLSFRNIPLGSNCNVLVKKPNKMSPPKSIIDGSSILKTENIYTSKINIHGSNYFKESILGYPIICEYKCKYGKLYSGSYLGIPKVLDDNLLFSINKKYGKYTESNLHNYIWDLGNGKKIILSKKSSFLDYIDRNLSDFLQKKEDLRIYNELVKEGSI